MSYTAAAALGIVGAVLVDLYLLRSRVVLGRAFWCAYPIFFGFQLLSNGILTGRGVVLYRPSAILGVRIVYAPVEDLAFGFALILLTLSIWTFTRSAGPAPPGPPR